MVPQRVYVSHIGFGHLVLPGFVYPAIPFPVNGLLIYPCFMRAMCFICSVYGIPAMYVSGINSTKFYKNSLCNFLCLGHPVVSESYIMSVMLLLRINVVMKIPL
jgi:hypothetical protein